ncbi:MAG: hypothetical protein AAGA92_09885 [Planctomycetota bacterium]
MKTIDELGRAFVFVRSYWRRPAYSFGRGPKTEHVIQHVRRLPRR